MTAADRARLALMLPPSHVELLGQVDELVAACERCPELAPAALRSSPSTLYRLVVELRWALGRVATRAWSLAELASACPSCGHLIETGHEADELGECWCHCTHGPDGRGGLLPGDVDQVVAL